MASYTSAYSSFIRRLDEVELLRRFASEREKTDAIRFRKEINALCRGGIVLLCGHLEAFIKELGEVALDSMHSKKVARTQVASRLYYHISKNLLDEIQDTSDPERLADKVFAFIDSDLDFWSKVGPFPQTIPVDRFNKGFSNPAFKKIKSYFNRFGYSEYKSDLARVLKADYQLTINMVDHLVDTRNKIAHGDPAATKTPSEVKDLTAIIRIYCITTDTIFASWCGRKFCPIR
jgi:RiboL-PSP-HEPN